MSFLRRTEYISSSMPRRPDGAHHARGLLVRARRPARPAPDASADSPQAIKREIDRGFDAAAQDLADPKRVRHPAKKHLKLVEALPLLPDLDAFPDSGAYVTIKFLTNPVPSSREYDGRLLSGLFRPLDRTPAEEALYEAALEIHDRDPLNNPKPANFMNYDLYLPQTVAVADRFRRKFDVEDPDHESDYLYTHGSGPGGRHFQFNRVRTYETAHETELDHATKYDDEIILSYNDDDAYPKQRALYYYPVMQRSAIRPQRTKNIARTNGFSQDSDEQMVDQLDITVEEPPDDMRDAVRKYREKPLEWDNAADDQQSDAEREHDADADGAESHRRGSDMDKLVGKSPEDQDRDAEGEDDEDE